MCKYMPCLLNLSVVHIVLLQCDSQHSILNDTQVKQLYCSLPGHYQVDAVPSVSDSPSREFHASIATAGSEVGLHSQLDSALYASI